MKKGPGKQRKAGAPKSKYLVAQNRQKVLLARNCKP